MKIQSKDSEDFLDIQNAWKYFLASIVVEAKGTIPLKVKRTLSRALIVVEVNGQLSNGQKGKKDNCHFGQNTRRKVIRPTLALC